MATVYSTLDGNHECWVKINIEAAQNMLYSVDHASGALDSIFSTWIRLTFHSILYVDTDSTLLHT